MVFRINLPTASKPRGSDLAQRALAPDPIARAAGFGRWWYDPHFRAVILSLEAAKLLGETPGVHGSPADSFSGVVPDDLLMVTNSLAPGSECEFRVLTGSDGLRWLRLCALPAEAGVKQDVVEGIVADITTIKLAAMREQFSFESTQLMIGTSTLDEAVSKILALVCTNLGWDCGMYWPVAQSGSEAGRLVLSHYWSGEECPPESVFDKIGGHRLSIAPREGVVGAVWSSGKARWIEDISTDPEFLYPDYARQTGIRSGYAFPVAYDSDDGRRHRPGVLIFFSCLSRQRNAQLPQLSAAIGGLIAQTAQRLAQQENIRELAQVDALSGLANRRHFHDLLDGACQRAAARELALGVLFIDLDRFKPINDGLGHTVGDAVLNQFAQRLAALVPRGAHAGRVGGDEFALFLYPGDSPARMQEMADKVLQAARTRFVVDGRDLVISASVGVSMFPADGANAAELLRTADTAMYRAKRSGSNGVGYFSDDGSHGEAESQGALLQQLAVEAELVHALADGRLFLEYQPVFDTTSGAVRAVEALVRWRRTDGSVVPPDVFIPVAEKSHLIVDIGRWVIRQACLDLQRMHVAGLDQVRLNVNMAAREFMNASLPAELAEITAEAGVGAHFVCLELTEGMMMNHQEQVVPVMRALRGQGFRISVDDFGMGYSSLSRLKDLPISSLKIDRSFVRGLPHDQQDCAMVHTIVDIGRNMGLEVIAEGVENGEQLELLRTLGCTLVQGFLTGRPLPVEQLIATHLAV